MPERILRDLTDSERYNAVSANARDLFIRLINKADDYGLFYADAKRLRPLLYPLLLETVREADVSRLLAECEKAGLVRRYTADEREYLQVNRWRQRLRAKTSKFPMPPWGVDPPPDVVGRVSDIRSADDGHPRTETETETETETNTETGKPPNPLPPPPPALDFPKFQEAWERWQQHRREIRKPLKPTMAAGMFRQFEAWGIDRAVEAIDHTISMGWQGLREPDPPQRSTGSRNGRHALRGAEELDQIDAAIP